jgi:hypothetical protein
LQVEGMVKVPEVGKPDAVAVVDPKITHWL